MSDKPHISHGQRGRGVTKTSRHEEQQSGVPVRDRVVCSSDENPVMGWERRDGMTYGVKRTTLVFQGRNLEKQKVIGAV